MHAIFRTFVTSNRPACTFFCISWLLPTSTIAITTATATFACNRTARTVNLYIDVWLAVWWLGLRVEGRSKGRVEVLSEGNTRAEMDRKRGEYFRAGVRVVWEIDPRRRTLRVYEAADRYTDLTEADTLAGDPVLPGFRFPLSDLFAELDQHG